MKMKNKHTKGSPATHIQKFRLYWSGVRLRLQEEKKRPEQLLKRLEVNSKQNKPNNQGRHC